MISWCLSVALSFLLICREQFTILRNCRWTLTLEHSGAGEGETHYHMGYYPGCYNLTSLPQMLSSTNNAMKHLLFHLETKTKTTDFQPRDSFFQFPRQTAEEGLALVSTQNPFIGSWIVFFSFQLFGEVTWVTHLILPVPVCCISLFTRQ